MDVAPYNSIRASNTERTEEVKERSKVAQSYTPIKFTFCFSVFFLAVGFFITLAAIATTERSVRYDDASDCSETDWQSPQSCVVPVSFPADFSGEMNFYFELRNFYQNAQEYMPSRSLEQLRGSSLPEDSLDSCKPVVTLQDLGRVLDRSPGEVANPCGLIAKTVFNDTFSLVDSQNQTIEIDRKDINWGMPFESNLDEEFQWTDVEDEGFGVWMKTSGLPRVLKLWGRIHSLQGGNYSVHVDSRYDATEFNGEKHLVFVECNLLGGSHLALGISYLVFGAVLAIFSVLFVVKILKLRCKVQTANDIS